jgi:hypothetical protein
MGSSLQISPSGLSMPGAEAKVFSGESPRAERRRPQVSTASGPSRVWGPSRTAAPASSSRRCADARVMQRAIRREHGGRHARDATMSVVLSERASRCLDEVSGEEHLMIGSDRPCERLYLLRLSARTPHPS